MGEPIEPLDGHLFGAGQPCFGCGPEHPHGFRLRFEREGDAIVTRFVPGAHHQGPPGIMHGGLVSTLADEVAAWTVIGALGKFGFTASFEGRLHRPIRIGAEVRGEGRPQSRGRLVDVAVELHQAGERAFSGKFRFALVDQHSAARILGGPVPVEWERFVR